MNRRQAAKELRKNPEGLPVDFQGLEADFEIRPLWLVLEPEPFEDEEPALAPLLKAPPAGTFYLFFTRHGAGKPNGLVRGLKWIQVLNFIRRNFPK